MQPAPIGVGNDIKITGPATITSGEWEMIINYDYSAIGSQVVSMGSLLAPFGVDTLFVRDTVVRAMNSKIHDAIQTWERKISEQHTVIYLGDSIEYKDFTFFDETGGVTSVPIVSKITIRFKASSLLLAAVIVAGFVAAMATMNAIFPKEMDATFRQIGGLPGKIGDAVAGPLSAIGWPLAIGASILGAVFFFSR